MMPSLWFRVGWAVIVLLATIWEALALLDPEGGDTATEQIRWLVQWPPTWFLAAGILAWLIDHLLLHDFFFQLIKRIAT